jgi:hypothetical protein
MTSNQKTTDNEENVYTNTPPFSQLGKAWKATTDKTAKALRPSISAR